MLSNTVVEHEKAAAAGFAKITGVVHDIAKASAKDRELIKEETKALEKDLNKAVARAISIGEAKAKAVEQRIAEHLKDTKRYLQVKLTDYKEAGKGLALSSIGDILVPVGAMGAVKPP